MSKNKIGPITPEVAKIQLMNKVRSIVYYAKSFQDFSNWMEAIYAKQKSIANVNICYPAFVFRAADQTNFKNALIQDHLSLVSDDNIPNADFESTALTITLLAGVSSQYVLYMVEKLDKKGKFSESGSLLKAIQASMIFPNVDNYYYISQSTYQHQAENFTALIKSYPAQLCSSTFDITCIAGIITPGKDLFIAANITIICDTKKAEEHIKSLELARGANNMNSAYITIGRTHTLANQMKEAQTAKELYIKSSISYLWICQRIMPGWAPMATPSDNQPQRLSQDIIIHILSFVDSIPVPRPEIANGIIYKSVRLHIGGDLHNLMMTSTLSQRHKDAHLAPSCDNGEKWQCVKFALLQEIERMDGVTKNNS